MRLPTLQKSDAPKCIELRSNENAECAYRVDVLHHMLSRCLSTQEGLLTLSDGVCW